MHNKKKILFIFHEANLTGATLALFSIVNWLSKNSDISMSFLLKQNGVLTAEISKVGTVYNWQAEKSVKKNILKRIFKRIVKAKTHEEKLLEEIKNQEFDLIYANTIMCSDLIKKLAFFNSKIVWHIHELELAIISIGKHHLEAAKHVDYFIANSRNTMENLVRHGIDEKKISVHYPFIDMKKIQSTTLSLSIRESLHIPADAFVVGTSGTGFERKGIHNFIQLPLIIDYFFPDNNFYYVWVGHTFNKVIEYDLEKSGIGHKVLFTGEKKDPFSYYATFDIFATCSKEESFGLSAIEAAAFHKPLICFKNTGGIQEIVEQADNITVAYLDIIEMAKKIIDLYHNRNKATQLGNQAFEMSKKYDIELIMPGLYDYIKKLLSN